MIGRQRAPVCAAGIALLLATAPAGASTVVMQVIGTDSWRGGMIQFQLDGRPVSEFAGGIRIRLDSAPYEAFCVDLFHTIGFRSYTSQIYSPDRVDGGWRAAWLYATQLGGVDNVAFGQALQLALWDIVHDGGDGFSQGRIRAAPATPGPVVTLAEHYLAESAGQSSGSASVYVPLSVHGVRQSLLSASLGTGGWDRLNSTATPEPQALATAGAGVALLAAAWLRRRTRRGR